MPFVIAVLVLVAISFISLKFRAYMCFTMTMIGAGALIAGLIGGEDMFTYGGAAFLAGGLLILFISAGRVEKSRRFVYMGHLFIYGLFVMLRVTLIMTIVLIPVAAIVRGVCTSWHEVVVVDEMGRTVKNVYVDDAGRGSDGKQYTKYDNPY